MPRHKYQKGDFYFWIWWETIYRNELDNFEKWKHPLTIPGPDSNDWKFKSCYKLIIMDFVMVEKELMKDHNYFMYYIIYMDFKKKYLKYKKILGIEKTIRFW